MLFRSIGGDAGCGARVVGLPTERLRGLDALERRAREVLEAPAVEVDTDALHVAAWKEGPRGLLGFDLPEGLLALADVSDDDPPSGPVPEGMFGASLGTIGGGNHFLELAEVERAEGGDGLVRGGLAVVAHSGSRGLGKYLADRWPEGPIDGDTLARWRGELAGALRWARVNRLLLAWKMMVVAGATRPGRVGGTFDVVHNAVWPTTVAGAPAWLHRKGAAPAEQGQRTIVLGSRGAPSFVMEGLGHAGALCSVAHGAGRRMTRTEARQKLERKHTRASLARTPGGGRVLCDETTLLYEEHPDAYKPIEPIVAALEAFGAARTLARLRPVLTAKM